MMAGILMAGTALVGLSSISTIGFFYFFYLFNALGYVCGGPLPNQVLLSRWFGKARGKAMGFAYLGIGIGGALVPKLSYWLTATVRLAQRAANRRRAGGACGAANGLLCEREPGGRNWNANFGNRATVHEAGLKKLGLLPPGHRQHVFDRRRRRHLPESETVSDRRSVSALSEPERQSAAANVLSLILISSLFGRLFMGWLADRFPKKYVMLLIYTIVGCSIALLFVADRPVALYAFAVFSGLAWAATI